MSDNGLLLNSTRSPPMFSIVTLLASKNSRLLFASLFCLCGCTSQSPGVTDTSAHAKYVLVTALDAWRAGKAKSLSTRTPAIRFVDDDLVTGAELVDYEFENEAIQIKPFQNVRMVLSLRDSQGQTSRKVAQYQVGIEPGLTVLRSDN